MIKLCFQLGRLSIIWSILLVSGISKASDLSVRLDNVVSQNSILATTINGDSCQVVFVDGVKPGSQGEKLMLEIINSKGRSVLIDAKKTSVEELSETQVSYTLWSMNDSLVRNVNCLSNKH